MGFQCFKTADIKTAQGNVCAQSWEVMEELRRLGVEEQLRLCLIAPMLPGGTSASCMNNTVFKMPLSSFSHLCRH